MRRIKQLLTLILALVMSVSLFACGEKVPSKPVDPGDPPAHEHKLGNWQTDGTKHWKVCSGCGEKLEEGNCIAENEWKSDAEKHWNECGVCGGRMNEEAHTYYTKYDETCSICSAERDMVTVTFMDGDEKLKEDTIAKGETADDFYVDYCVVTWMNGDEVFDLNTPVTEDITLVAGTKTEHVHQFTWVVGSGEDEGYDIGTCDCGKIEKFATNLTPEDVQYIDMSSTSVELVLPLPEGYTATTVKYGDKIISEAKDGKITIDASAVFDASEYGERKLTVIAKGTDEVEHNFTLPVFTVTKLIKNVEDLAAVKLTADGQKIEGYYALEGNIDGAGAEIKSEKYAWSGDSGFCGTFDGRGYTISNITVKGCGIFGHIGSNAVIKNVNFDKVTLGEGIWADTCGAPLFSRVAANYALFENITVNYEGIYASNKIKVPEYGLLVSREMSVGDENPNDPTWRNITLTAKGITVSNALGLKVSDRIKFENVVIDAAEVLLLGARDEKGENIFQEKEGVTVLLPQKVTTFAAAEEGETAILLQNEIFKQGSKVKVIANGVEKEVSVAEEGKLSVAIADFNIEMFGKINVSVIVGETSYVFTDIWYVTKVIREFDDLLLLSNTKNARNTGYYILGNDIDGQGKTLDGGAVTAWNQNQGFGGTFDGRNCTVENFNVVGNGIFGGLGLGTVKNAAFKAVTLKAGSALFARTMYNSSVINVSVQLSAFESTSGECGIFVKRQTGTEAVYKDIVVDANGLDIYNVLGLQIEATVKVENFVINNAGEITLYGTSDSAGVTPIEKPEGMTVNPKTN